MKRLAVLVSLFVALALFYSLILPLFEGPDEDDHFRYARFIAQNRAVPIQEFVPGGGIAGHQGWQPPLYYTLAALVIAPIDTADFEQHLWRNYGATFVGDPACCGRNIYYHTDAQNVPFARTPLAVHLARLLSIFFGAITIIATYRLASTLTQNSMLALACAAVVAFNPSFLFASALVSNDTALAAFSSLALLLCVELLTGRRELDLRAAAWLGVWIGLGILTKTTALGLLPFAMLAIGIVAWRQRDRKSLIQKNVALLGVIALVSGGWFIRNAILYGDPLAYRLMTISALFPRAGELTLPELFQISLPWLWQTFWGGPTPGDFSPLILVGLAFATILSLIGFAFYVLRNRPSRVAALFLLGWLAFILVAQIQFIRTTTGADQGRYLFPAISVIALCFVIGLNELFSRVMRHPARFALSLLICSFAILAFSVPFAYTLPAYARPALLAPDARAAYPYQITFDDKMQLLGYDLDARAIKPSENLSVALYWRALTPMSESYRVFVHLVSAENRMAGGADVIPGRGAFPTVYWQPGDALRDVVRIPIAANASPGKYSIQVGLYPVGKPGERLVIANSDETSAQIASIKIAPAPNVAYAPQEKVNANFDNQIDLLGYDLDHRPDSVQLTLYWRARVNIERDYSVFVHALDADGKLLAQIDEQPQAGNYPTSIWFAGEQIVDVYTVARAAKIAVGLYTPASGARLPVTAANQVVDDKFVIDLAGAK